jgi:hypothetical protein
MGCQEQSKKVVNIDWLESKLYLDWIYAHSISEIKWKGVISRPVGVEVLLFQIERHCVYYRVPFKKIKGELMIVDNRELVKCSETPSGEVLYSLANINNLEVKLENFEIHLSFAIDEKKVNWSFPLYNLSFGSKHEKNRSEVEIKKINGLILINENQKLNSAETQKIGKFNDSYSLKTAVMCRRVNKDCEVVGEDICHQCQFGSFEVVDFQCLKGGSRYCGINHCGEKNEPACIRGMQTLDGDVDGICEANLNPVLNADHVLVCQ